MPKEIKFESKDLYPQTATLGTPTAKPAAKLAGVHYRVLPDGRIRIRFENREQLSAFFAASRKVEREAAESYQQHLNL